ncbi:MAG TPA: serine/threonine-protein kinase [Kofleriaceae bacterium]|nr:serine/threonine-protein kinase [Kofleriaceae bacterium]
MRDPRSGDLETLPAADVTATEARGSIATPSESMELPQIAASRYEMGSEVGRGGLGRVLRAHDRVLDREVAVKELLGADDGARRRFVREALITARLQHPSIVSVYEAGRWSDGAPFYAMKLVTGRTLTSAIAHCTNLDERLALLPHVLAVADAIAFAHAHRIIHRDLKPGNVLVGAFGETVVIDWGLAKDLSRDDPDAIAPTPLRAADGVETVAGAVLGTPGYMAPEQADGKDADERSDVYSLGAMLYHTVTGVIPHEGKTLPDIIDRILAGEIVPISAREPRVPADLGTIIAKAMALDPSRRYANAKSLAEDLRRFQTGKLVGAHTYSRIDRVVRWIRRHRAVAIVAATALLVLLAYGTWSVRRIVGETARADRARDDAIEQRDQAIAAANRALVAQAHDALSRNPTEALVYLRQLDPRVDAGWSAARLITADVLSRPREIAAIDQLPPRGRVSMPVHDRAGRHLVIANEDALYVLDVDHATMRRYPIVVDRAPIFCDDDRRIAAVDARGRAFVIDADAGAMTASPDADARVAYARCAAAHRALVDGGEVRFWDEHDGAFHAVAHTRADLPSASSDGASLVAIEGDELVQWTRAGEARRVPVGEGAEVYDLTADGRVVIAGPGDHKLAVHLDTGARVALFPGRGPVRLSPDGARVVMGSASGVDVVDTATGLGLRGFGADLGELDDVSFSPDEAWVLARRGDDLIAYDTNDVGTTYRLIGHRALRTWWTPRGLLAWDVDSSLRVWSFDGARIPRTTAPIEDARSPDGRWRVTTDDTSFTRENEHLSRREHDGEPLVADDGRVLIVGERAWWTWPRGGAPVIESRRTDEPVLDQAALQYAPRVAIARAADGRWAAIGRPGVPVELVDLHTLDHHPLAGSAGIGVAFLPDGSLVTGRPEGGLLAWNPRDGSHRTIVAVDDLRYADNMPFAIASSPDGATLAVGGGPLATIDVASGRVRALAPVDRVRSLAFFDGGRALAAGGDDLVIVDLASGFTRHVPIGRPGALVAAGDAILAGDPRWRATIRNALPRDRAGLRAIFMDAPGVDDAAHPRVAREARP